MGFKALEDLVLRVPINIFGTDLTYTPLVGSPVDIKGIFENKYVEVNGIQSLSPILTINLNDLEGDPVRGDTVTIGSVNYRILESRKDGLSASILILQKV